MAKMFFHEIVCWLPVYLVACDSTTWWVTQQGIVVAVLLRVCINCIGLYNQHMACRPSHLTDDEIYD